MWCAGGRWRSCCCAVARRSTRSLRSSCSATRLQCCAGRYRAQRCGPEGCLYLCPISGGGLVVLVDEAAGSVAAVDLAVAGSLVSLVGLGRPEFERTVRALAVVVLGVDAEHVFEVTAVEDQQPVQALGTHGPH